MSLISWNAQGLGNPRAFNRLSLLVKNHKPTLLFLMETRLKPNSVDRFKRALGFVNGFEVRRKYFGGGLLLLWGDDVVNIINYSTNHIDCIINLSSNYIWHLTFFYGSPVTHQKHITWKLLHNIYYNAANLPWLVIGDFNSYLSNSDKSGGSSADEASMDCFHNFLHQFTMAPLSYSGNKFTWTNKTIRERLDWAVASDFWYDFFPEHSLHHLGFYGSDHRVLKLVLTSSNPRANPTSVHKHFRFENIGLEDPSFYTTVDTAWKEWSNSHPTGSGFHSFLAQQDNCVSALKTWNKKSNHSKSNRIKYLKNDEGVVVNTQEGIAELVISYFSDLFSSQAAASIFESLGPGLDEPEITFLAQDFTADEVKRAVFQLSGDKAVGLDGLNAFFYQKNWSVLGADFTKAILACLNQGSYFTEINSTLIVLIPKKQHANTLKDFRPISLCTTLYKDISKILANRLKKVLDKIISPCQSTFVSGHIIQDNILIANELVHAIKNRTVGTRGWAALKLDMTKAFDRVEWDFLRHHMFHFHFPVHFVSLIFRCLTTASISFSINGQVHGSLKPTRGLRQGDPISPYLFILCSEGLSALLQNFQNRELLRGIAISRRAPSITHLLFADDSFLFCTADKRSCETLHHALSIYSKASGQMVNFAKSSILFSPNTRTEVRSLFFQTFQLEGRAFITTYLGLPQCLSRVKYPAFTFLKDKVATIFHSWNHKWFSRAGKETLIKAVLQAIPSYAMACYRIPTKICKEIESLISKFWWGSSAESHKVHWKNWSSVFQSKFVGGLGFRCLTHFNQAMLAKQAWRIFQYPDSLLCRVLKARYFPHSFILEAVVGLIRKVGNGLSIRTIGDHWFPGCRFKSYSTSAPPTQSLSFFLSPSGDWDRGKLIDFFDDSLVEDILQSWDMPTSSSFASNKSFWTKIWASTAPPKIKHLIWRALSHSLPVASSLFFRHIITNPLCPVCQLHSEIVEHAILGCNHARKAWKHSKFFTFYTNHKDSNFSLFLASALDAYNKFDLALLFCFIWSIWSQRNNLFHKKVGLSSYHLFDYAANYLHEYIDANAKQMVLSSPALRQNRREVQLPAGQWIVYTDATLDLGHMKHSYGVVAFDNAGCSRAGFMAPCSGVVSPEVA
ncbi:uncharacterized protein LOC115710694 [Cannabis sativa]|uniref:uncharacterized protein LOC115710694 n=1 Tax=Cannabis sativa TaxID=3483 RepID=UPI0029CA8DAB|nr:uncharacterized protein LOC115710694 [Cannabis sativa]